MSLRAVRSPEAPKMTIVQGSVALSETGAVVSVAAWAVTRS